MASYTDKPSTDRVKPSGGPDFSKFKNPREFLNSQGIQSGQGGNYWKKIAQAAGFGGRVKAGWMKDPNNAELVRLIMDIANGHAKKAANGGWINERPDGYTSFDAQGNPTWHQGSVPAGSLADQGSFMNTVASTFGLTPPSVIPPSPMAGLTPAVINTAYTKPQIKPPEFGGPTGPPTISPNPTPIISPNPMQASENIKPLAGNTGPLPPTQMSARMNPFVSGPAAGASNVNPIISSGMLSQPNKKKPLGMFQ